MAEVFPVSIFIRHLDPEYYGMLINAIRNAERETRLRNPVDVVGVHVGLALSLRYVYDLSLCIASFGKVCVQRCFAETFAG